MIEPYIETSSGKAFYFMDPKPDQIDIEDIAFALSNNCRFNGHCSGFMSVAEHSVAVARRLKTKGFGIRLCRTGLLHDAAEAYITDMPSPIKQFLPDYNKMEDRIMEVIGEKYNLDFDNYKEVKQADWEQLSDEAHYLLPSKGNDWSLWSGIRPDIDPDYMPLNMEPKIAAFAFMKMFKELNE